MFAFVVKTCSKLHFSSLALFRGLTYEPMLSLSNARRHEHTHARARAHTHTHLAGFQSLRGGGINSLLLRGATPSAACMMVMNFLYFMLKLLRVNLLP